MNVRQSRLQAAVLVSCVLILSVFAVLGVFTPTPQGDLPGVWRAEHLGNDVEFVFNKSGACTLSYTNRKSGKKTVINGLFELDFSKRPMALSVRKIPQLNYSLYTIVEFVNEDVVRVGLFSQRWRLRPVSFNRGSFLELKRSPHI